MEGTDKQEILEAIGLIADQMQEMRFDIVDIKSDVGSLKSNVGTLKSDVGSMKSNVGSLKSDVGSLKSNVVRIKATMVTKDYLDDKFADFHSDVVNFIKRRVPCWTESGV